MDFRYIRHDLLLVKEQPLTLFGDIVYRYKTASRRSDAYLLKSGRYPATLKKSSRCLQHSGLIEKHCGSNEDPVLGAAALRPGIFSPADRDQMSRITGEHRITTGVLAT